MAYTLQLLSNGKLTTVPDWLAQIMRLHDNAPCEKRDGYIQNIGHILVGKLLPFLKQEFIHFFVILP